jgi:hypothetical protein
MREHPRLVTPHCYSVDQKANSLTAHHVLWVPTGYHQAQLTSDVYTERGMFLFLCVFHLQMAKS